MAKSPRKSSADTPELRRGLRIERVFSQEGVHPFDTVTWERRTAAIYNSKGEAVFEQKDVEFPSTWSQLATNVVASKYFYGDLAAGNGDPREGKREYSLKQLIHRVTRTIADWGKAQGYFATPEDAERFYDELTWLCLHQYGAFNSPVWFNVGLYHQYGVRDTGGKTIYGWDFEKQRVVPVDPYERPQASACFIISVEDSIDDIWQLMAESARLFKFGSGVGADWSKLRSTKEKLSGGGRPSGPVSFMRVQDATGATIKSGGKTRRAAIMQTLKVWHPDIMEFVTAKAKEEKKAWALIEQGYDGSFNGEAYSSVAFQNVNQSVRVTDEFMEAVLARRKFPLKAVTTGEVIEEIDAYELLYKVAEGTWICGDPGLQYEDTIQRWHTCKNSGPINSSNPCVTGDTLVATEEGLRRIDSLVGETPRVVGLDGRLHRTTRVIETGVKPVYRLRTRCGYEVKLTADHPVWTENRGDVPAAELTRNDIVRLVPPRFGREHLDPEVAEYIGLMVGDGCISHEVATLMLDRREKAVAEKVAHVVNQFDRKTHLGGVRVAERPTGVAVATGARAVQEVLKRFAMLDEGSSAKRFTEEVFRLDRQSVAALLRGLFTADGTVANYGRKSQYISLESTSRELLKQVQLLLLGFGIKSKLYENRRLTDRALLPDGRGGIKEYRVQPLYSLRISRSSRVRFEREIGFLPESPKAAALRALNATVSAYEDPLVDQVVSLELLGEEPVYDLTEPVTDHFVANGIAVHNCSEYMFLDNSACNLASLNLRKFQREDGSFDVERFRAAVRIFITAMEILVDNAGYPSEKIAQNSHDYRPLGLGFANLGAMLMAMGLPYDSDEGRAVAGAITAVMHAEAYARSAEIAAIEHIGPFPGFEKNREPMLEVMRLHQAAVEDIHPNCPAYLKEAARESMARMVALGERYGYRNAQATVLAPTGCLVGDSLIATDRGLVRLQTLGNPEGPQWQHVSFRVFTDEGQKLATRFYVNGIEATRKIRTRAGYTIQGTLQHRIKVVDPDTGQWVWKRFSDIRPGDIVPLAMNTIIGQPRTVTLPPLGELHWNADRNVRVPRTVTPELAELVGYFMGDGSLHAKGLRFCVDARDQDVVAHLQQLIYRLFGLQAYTEPRQGYVEVGVHSVPLVLWWEACGFAKRLPSDAHQGKGYQPYIPDALLYTNDPAVYRAFLRGLFEADGTVIQGVPAFSTASESLAQEVRTLLLALGYPTQTKVEEDRRSARGQKSLQVLRLKNRGYNARFLQEIGFIGVRKRQAVAEATTRSSAKRDRIYLEPALVEELVPAGSPHRDAVMLSVRRYGAIPRQRVEQLYEETGDERLIQYMSYFYDVVEANEDGGEQLTYDLSVPENVTYTANGFISHNTISFMMDCDTTGIEPDIALVKYKLLAGKGDGMFKIVNNTVPIALRRLGYSEGQIKDILAYIEENDTIEGAPHLKEEHLPVFDCAFKPYKGQRFIHYMGHIKMMAACQPFISGAISKTVNMPEHVTVEEIMDAYVQGWKLGLKALAIYRENSKRSQPLSTRKEDKKGESSGDGMATAEPKVIEKVVEKIVYKPVRKRLPDERPSITHKFSVAGHEGYLHIGLYPDTGMPGEIFITMAKQGSTISGLMDAFATAISIALQYGVPLEDLCNKFSHMRFEPAGFTNNPQIPIAKSIMDYIFRYLSLKFLGRPQEEKQENPRDGVAAEVKRSGPARDERQLELTFDPQPTGQVTPLVGQTIETFLQTQQKSAAAVPEAAAVPTVSFQNQEDAPACSNCGSITVRSGACYVCPNCGSSSGCG